MLSNVFLKTVRDQRRSLMWWGTGVAALSLITMLFYPSLSNAPELNALLSDNSSLFRAFVGDITDLTSPEGFLNSQLFFLMIPLLFLGFAIAQGSGVIAGEEEKGTLDLLMSNPVSRRQVMAHKSLAIVMTMLALAAATWAGLVAGVVAVGMDISLLRIAEATLSASLLGMAFGAFALALGSATGRRASSIGIASGVGVAAYFINALAPLSDSLEPARRISPFYYYNSADPLANGLHLGHAGVLVAATAILYVLATAAFERRDLGV